MKHILVKADMNDADYTEHLSQITDEQLEIIMPVIDAIKEYKKIHGWRSNWDDESWPWYEERGITEEQFDIMSDFVPGGGDYPIHAIESITILEVTEVTCLF